MQKKLQRPPSRRNVEIFYDVVSRGKKQVEVANQHRLSQARVSQIINQVRRYNATVKPLLTATAEQQTYYYCDIYGAALHDLELTARQAYAEQQRWCRAAEAEEQTRRPPRADTRLLSLATELLKEQANNTKELVAAGEKCKETHRQKLYRQQLEAKALSAEAENPPKSNSSEELPKESAPDMACSTPVAEPPAQAETVVTTAETAASTDSTSTVSPPTQPRRIDPWFKLSGKPKPPPKPRDPNVIIWHSMLRE